MKPATAATALTRPARTDAAEDAWRERSGRLFTEFERPAKAMVRRAFGSALSVDEIDDVYAGAWVGTLRALADRHRRLTDEEIRSYLLTAVANQAGKEMRRRKRKPTAPLELVGGVPDNESGSPEERAAEAEESQITRDLLASLPPRRRAVMLLRYGWGLEPKQVCGLVSGLSPRAYRKEVTRGVDELTEKMRAFERGDWCADREPILKAYASGLANVDQARQAKAHLAHCRECTDFVARLRGHLHDLGGAAAIPGAIDGIDGHVGLVDRLLDASERFRHGAEGLLGRAAPPDVAGPSVQVASGAGGQLAAMCGGVATVACVAAIAPGLGQRDVNREPPKQAIEREAHKVRPGPRTQAGPVLPSQVGNEAPPVAASAAPSDASAPRPTSGDEPTTEAAPTEPVAAEEAPESDFTFGTDGSSAPAPEPPAPTGASSSGGGANSGGSSSSAGDFAFGN